MKFITKKLLRSTSIFSFIAILLLLYTSQSPFYLAEQVWIFTQYSVPLLFLGIWVPYALSFFIGSRLEVKSLNRTFNIAIFGSVAVVLGALMLNTHLLILILHTIISLFEISGDDLLVSFLINEIPIGILLPLNEEIVKILPIIAISHAGVLIMGTEEDNLQKSILQKQKTIISRREYALYGITSGVVFTFLELFLYQWQSIEAASDPFSIVFEQVSLRTLAPVHVLASMFFALGIYSLKRERVSGKTKSVAVLSSVKFFLLGWGLHAFWNSLNVYLAIYLPSRMGDLTIILFGIGFIVNLILITYIWKIFRNTPKFCKSCGFEGQNHQHIEKSSYSYPKVSLKSKILSFPLRISKRKLSYSYVCQYCFSRITKGACSTCGSRSYLACPNCNTYISETTNICPNPNCAKKIVSLVENQFVTLSRIETWIIGISALTSLTFILSPMSILFLMNREIYFSITIMIFYFVIGLTIIINVFIALFINRTAGILVLYCYILNLTLLIFIVTFGTTLIGFFRALLFLDVLGMILLSIIFIIVLSFGVKSYSIIYKNYIPIFPEFAEERQVVIENE